MLHPDQGAIFLIDKPLHWTSFDVVNKLRYALLKNLHKWHKDTPDKKRKIKVGHAGTLDPLATGLLIVCAGRETKKIEAYMATEKEYTGTLVLGATTPSYDMETEPTATYPTHHITQQMVLNAAQHFTGSYNQLPPIFSAIKKDGKRLYESARAGIETALTPRSVHIAQFEITNMRLPEVDFRVVCSKGTYIRSLAHDFGKYVQSGAYLSKLCRTRSGAFLLDDAWQLAALINKINTEDTAL
jgi:tRNA pseudouridine55 synthase